LTLEEVDELYNECKSASKSTKWRPTVSFRERESVAAQGGKTTHDSDEHQNGVVAGHHENEKSEVV